jgi:tetratricopeptide (TPR) repeat protein
LTVRRRALAASLAANAALAVLLAFLLAPADPGPPVPWATLARRAVAGVPLSPAQLATLGSESAAWSPFLRARAQGASFADALEALPDGPLRARLAADAAISARQNLAAAFTWLEAAGDASLPWRRDDPADRWRALALAAELGGKPGVAARASLRVGELLGPERGLPWVDRAFDLDPHDAALAADAVAPWLLEAAADASQKAEGRGSVSSLRVARERLFHFRLSRPDAAIPEFVLYALLNRLAESPVELVREAALPGLKWLGHPNRADLLAYPVTQATVTQLGSHSWPDRTAANRGDLWQEWLVRAFDQSTFRRRNLQEEILFWHPRVPLVWSELARTNEDTGNWRRALIARKIAARKEVADPRFARARVAGPAFEARRYEETIDASSAEEDLGGAGRKGREDRLRRALALLALGRAQEAASTLEPLELTTSPEGSAYWAVRVDVLNALGQDATEAQRRLVTLAQQEADAASKGWRGPR